MSPIQLPKACEFYIKLETDHILFHGSVEESAGAILRGCVVLNCKETIRVKSITLKFLGKAKASWIEGIGSHQAHYKDETTLIEHDWQFMPPTLKNHQLSVGHHQWNFELPLPGNLAESITHHLGSIDYRLKATVDRPAFLLNYIDKKKIHISRVLSPISLELNQSISVSNVWTDKLSYDISLPGKVFPMGTVIPITFDLIPIAADLKVMTILCSLKEYATLLSHCKTDTKVIKQVKDDHSCKMNGDWKEMSYLKVPSTAHMDSDNDLLNIHHELNFIVSLMNADGHVSEIRATIPIIVVDISPEQDIGYLPAYEDAWRTAPYDPSTLAIPISTPSQSCSMPYSTAANVDTSEAMSHLYLNENREVEEWPSWEGGDLSRVPSYTTAIHSRRLHSFSGSLPTYDSVFVLGSNA
ncbi:hypothetical protein BDF14DRAFT_1861243 [Spinellus fusiger]|nr:hypothetical protein BDF14DRAFT_1861243 [Spinellus fusiger]